MIKWKPEAIEAAFRAFDDKKYEVLSKRGKAKIAPDMEYILNEAVRAQGLVSLIEMCKNELYVLAKEEQNDLHRHNF